MKFGPDRIGTRLDGNSSGAVAASLALAAALPALGADLPAPPPESPLTNQPRIDVPIPRIDSAFGSSPRAPGITFTGSFPAATTNPSRATESTARLATNEVNVTPAPEHINGVQSAAHWIDVNLGGPTSWLSNLIQIGTYAAGLLASFLVIRSYRKNPQSFRKESLLLREGRSPVFLHDGKEKISSMFGDLVERVAVFTAARKTTEKFPILFIDPVRYPEVVSEFRDAVATKDLKSAIEEDSSPSDLKSDNGKWHLVIVPRRSYLGSSPILKADFFSFTKMVAMLEEPVRIYHQLKGMDQCHILYHFEGAALVSYLHPTILNRAIREAHIDTLAAMPDDETRQKFIKETAARLTHNSKILLRLLDFSTEDSLAIFNEVTPGETLDHLEDIVPFEKIERMIAERRKAKSIYEHTVEPIIHWLWKENDASKVWLAARTPPEKLGLFDCCTVAEM